MLMGRVNPESMKDWKDGDIVMAADYKQERELLRVAINDNFDRLIKKFIAVNRNGSVKTTTDLNAALNELRFREGDNVILSMDKDTATLTISVEYGQGSVDTPALKDGSVVRAKIANGAVHVEKIADGAVTEAKIANNAVTTSKIANNSVTNAKIANQSVTTEKIQTGALDGRYYTKQEVNAQLAQKTDRTGDHQGTWHGLRVEDIDPEGFDAARITALERKLSESDVRDIQLNRGLQIVEADEASPLHLIKVEGKTEVKNIVINILPHFNNWTVEQPNHVNINNQTKMIVQPFGSTVAHINISVKKGAWYTVFGKVKDPSLRASLNVSSPHGNVARLDQDTQSAIFQVPNNSSFLLITISGSSFNESVFEDICIVEGIRTDLDFVEVIHADLDLDLAFVEGIKNLRGLYVKRYGKNLLPPFYMWETVLPGEFQINEPYNVRIQSSNTFRFMQTFVNVVPGQVYTLSYQLSSGRFQVISVNDDGSLGSLLIELGGDTSPTSGSFTIPAGINRICVRITNHIAGICIWSKPMLNVGSEPLPFEPQNNDYLYADVELASNQNATVRDVLEYRDGRYWKVKRFNKIVLDGSLDWEFATNYTMFKSVRITDVSSVLGQFVSNSQSVTRYDGLILDTITSGFNKPDQVILRGSDDTLFITVSNTYSGWVDGVVPTSGAIKALMNGWKATANNGTVYTAWESILDPSETRTDENYVANYKATGWTGWATLQYQLAEPVIEDVTDKVHGSISLLSGKNAIEVGEAMIVNEIATPYTHINGNTYINNTWDSNLSTSKLNYRLEQFLQIRRNGNVDSMWEYIVSPASFGRVHACIPTSDYDPSATYTVTYLAEPWQLSSSVQSVAVQYGANVKTALDRTIQDVADLKTVVNSEIPANFASKFQEDWIRPTLLNGWSSVGVRTLRYYKDNFGTVHIAGLIGGGVNTPSTLLFTLPEGYRPRINVGAQALTWSNETDSKSVGITVDTQGRVTLTHQASTNIEFNFSIRANG